MKTLTELEQAYAELGKEIEKLKAEKHEYPIYCKDKQSFLVLKFTGLKDGKVVIQSKLNDIGHESSDWISHTNKNVWQPLTVCPKTGFFDGQLVWAWDDDDTHRRELRLYDAVNQCPFSYDGERDGYRHTNYSPFEGNYPDWAIQAFNTLKLESESE